MSMFLIMLIRAYKNILFKTNSLYILLGII